MTHTYNLVVGSHSEIREDLINKCSDQLANNMTLLTNIWMVIGSDIVGGMGTQPTTIDGPGAVMGIQWDMMHVCEGCRLQRG